MLTWHRIGLIADTPQLKQLERNVARGIAEAAYDAQREPRFVARSITSATGRTWIVDTVEGERIATFAPIDASKLEQLSAQRYAKAFIALAEAMADEDEAANPLAQAEASDRRHYWMQ